MKRILNGKLINNDDLQNPLFERGYSYGDGLFETIIVRNGNIQFLDYHIERLHSGMRVLSMKGSHIDKVSVEQCIGTLLDALGMKEDCRIKLLVWRQAGGLYTPATNSANILISASELNARSPVIKACGIAETIRLHNSVFSSLKTCNALPYVIAALEKKSRNLDEIIILDNHHYIAECSSSNLFWLKNENIYTPSLESGCIAGVMRRHILQQAKQTERGCYEVMENLETLLSADQVFCCNVTGVYPLENFEGRKYNTKLDPQIAKWLVQ